LSRSIFISSNLPFDTAENSFCKSSLSVERFLLLACSPAVLLAGAPASSPPPIRD